jgi:hypothetical protein
MINDMKITVSVPDDLWAEASPDDSNGPSDTVQRALRALAEQLRASKRPLASAPDQSNLEKYQPMFDEAVEITAKTVGAALDNGYRFGLLLAPGLTPGDFETIDVRGARSEIQEIVFHLGTDGGTDFSLEFADHVQHVLDWSESDENRERRDLLDDVLGTEDTGAWTGVLWTSEAGEAEWINPRLSDTFADGVLAALRDVRDEATRRMTSDGAGNKEGN